MVQFTLDLQPLAEPAQPAPLKIRVIPFAGHYGNLAVECPSCKAKPGRRCRRPSGHAGPAVGPDQAHQSRHEAAMLVRLDGVSCAYCGVADGPESAVAPVRGSREARALGVVGDVVCRACADCVRRRALAAPPGEAQP